MAGLRHALGILEKSGTGPLLLGLVVLLPALGCAAQRAYQDESRVLIAEADEEERRLAATGSADAFLLIARARSSAGGSGDLVVWTRHPDPAVRAEAVRTLALVGELDFAPAMAAALSDPETVVRQAAAFALSQHWSWVQTDLEKATHGAEIERWLLEALEDGFGIVGDALPTSSTSPTSDLPFARSLLRALGEFQGQDGTEALFQATQLAPLRDAARLALAVRGKNGRLPPLSEQRLDVLRLGMVEGSTDWTLAYLLARAGVEDAPEAQAGAESLLAALRRPRGASSSGLDAQAGATRALGQLEPGQAVPSLLAALGPEVALRLRLNAVRAAIALGPEGAPVLLKALLDVDERIRVEAARALGGDPSDEGFQALVAGLFLAERRVGCSSPDVEGRLRGLAAYPDSWEAGDARHTKLQSLAEAGLACEDRYVRAAAAGLLASLPGEGVARRLQALAEGELDRLVLLEEAVGIASRVDPSLEGLLLRWLAGPDPVLGAIAAEGLGKREGEHLTASLFSVYESSSQDGDWERRLAIVEALAARGELSEERASVMGLDPAPQVRRAVYQARLSAVGRTGSIGVAAANPSPEGLDDATWAVADVIGATVATDRGSLRLALYPQVAPATVASFVRLASEGSYDGLSFHRVVPDFVVQGGDPEGTGWGGPGYTLRDEFSAIPYRRGTVGMARAGLNTAGSQWFITHSPQPHLDGHYTVFGQVEEGMNVVDALRRGDRIRSIEIHRNTQ